VSQRRYPETAEQRREHLERAVLVGVDSGNQLWPLEESLAELERLAETAGAEVLATVSQRRDRPNSRTFIGAGKAEEIAALVRELDATLVIFDDDLTPSQQANLENAIPETKIVDRTALILDIFALHAVSREGKLQVELAQMEYLLPRLRGLWRHLDKYAGGGVMTRGPGESQLETDRRLARKRISALKRELAGVSRERELQRRARSQSGVYRIALVGYTNAGKSTLLNAMTEADVLQADMLFATLDSTTRRVGLPEGREATLTDTVGFIHKLPHGLVEAFKSTLDEVNEADLLLHVVDASAHQRDAQMQAVREVLHEIGASRKPSIVVYNKVDQVDARDLEVLQRRQPGAEFVSGLSGFGLSSLLARVASEASRGGETLTVLVPYTRGDLIALAHERAHVSSERHGAEGTALMLTVPRELVATFAPFRVQADVPEHEAPSGSEDDAGFSAED
jgi:GTPase